MGTYAIIGFGYAGFQAMRTISESDPSACITIFSSTSEPPANPMLTTYYAGGRIPRKNLFPFGSLESIQTKYPVTIHSDSSVVSISASTHTVTLADQSVFGPFDRILIATGAAPVVPPIGAIPGNRILCMRTVEDADLLRARLTDLNIRSAVVVGGSMVGIKVAELFADRGIPCTLADMADYIFPLSAFPSVAQEIMRRIEAKGVHCRFGSGISSVSEDSDSVTTFFADGTSVRSDLLILCIGTRASTRLAVDAGIEVNRGILVDTSMQTSVSGIYAAGDCCESRNLMTGESQVIGLWANAGWQGQAAGASMAGLNKAYVGNIIHNITHFMGMDFISIGDVHAAGTRYTAGTPDGRRYLEAVVGPDRKLLCINLLDSYRISGVIRNYMLNRFSGNRQPLPSVLRGLLAAEGLDDQFIRIFEEGCDSND